MAARADLFSAFGSSCGRPSSAEMLLGPGRTLATLVIVLAILGISPLSAVAQSERPRLVGTFTSEDGKFKNVGPLRFSPDGRTLAIVTAEGLVLWEVATRQVRARLEAPGLIPFGSVEFAPDGKSVYAGGDGSPPRLWDLATGRSRILPVLAVGVVRPMALSRDGKVLAIADKGGALKLWDTTTFKELATLQSKEAEEQMSGLAFSPDGKTLAALGWPDRGSGRGHLWLWDVAGRRLRTRHHLETASRSLMFSPDGKYLAVGQGGPIWLCDAMTGQRRASLEVPLLSPTLRALVISSDGRVLATGSGQTDVPGFMKGSGEVKFWDVTSQKELLTFRAHEDGIVWMALSPDGRLLAVSTLESSYPMNLWDVSAVTGRKPPDRPPAAPVRVPPDPVDQGPAPAGNPTPEELQKRWSDLAGADAARAYQAIWALAGASRQAVPFLGKHLQPVPPIDPKRVEQLLADLESGQFAVRQRAVLELEKAEEQAEPALRKVLQGKPRPETRSQVEKLLEKLTGPVTAPEKLQALRSLEVLEHIGTQEAQRVLKALAEGSPLARMTQEAKLSLDRLAKRPR